MKRTIFVWALIALFLGGAAFFLISGLHRADLPAVMKEGNRIVATNGREPVNLPEIMTSLVLFIGGILSLQQHWQKTDNKKEWEQNREDHVQFSAMLTSVQDRKDKDSILDAISTITTDFIDLVDEPSIQDLIGSIGSRTRLFLSESLTKFLTSEQYRYATISMNNLARDGREQVNSMKFSKDFKAAFGEIQCDCINHLRDDLKKIERDKIENHKYERFGIATKDFLKMYLKKVIKAYTKIEIAKIEPK